jgi:serine carboxypeptidase-like clade 1
MIYSSVSSSLLLSSLLLSGVDAAVESDKVTTLPGYQGNLPSTHYSGYMPVGDLSGTPGHLHYWFIESESAPSEDPVVLWLNGGPGSSSLIGLLTENGQIVTNDDSLLNPIDGVPQVYYNKYSWSASANMLYLESPKGVGFSYCDEATSTAQCVNDDTTTSQDAYEFLVNWFAAFPEYKSNKFYITGESYAGIYIPMMMDQLTQDVLHAKINLVGSAIGNGCWGNTVGTCAFSSPEAQQISAAFYFGHGMYSQTLRTAIDEACGDFTSMPPKCLKQLSLMNEEIGNFDIYNIYDECGRDDRRRLKSSESSLMGAFELMSQQTVTVETADSFKVSAGYGQALNGYQCGAESAMDAWLAEPSVVEALHVKAGTSGMKYDKTATDMRPLYAQLIDQYQMLIYSGDTDGCVPYVGTETWTRGLNYSVTEDWHQWMGKPDDVHSLHKAGYAVTYDKFQFITVNGAGHMVPQFQPGFAKTMFEKFLADETF